MAGVQHYFCLCWSSFVCMNQLLYRCSDILSIETTKEGSVYFGLKFQANTESWWGRQGTRNRECLAILHMQLGNWSRKPSQAIKAQNLPTMILPSAILLLLEVSQYLCEEWWKPWVNMCYYHEHIHVKDLSSLEVQGLAKPFTGQIQGIGNASL